ncbi:MAG: lasso peptide biosynthesis B2 protein [Bacteroidetes bacterium]|nr:lasso peptide biosynthesis B2 protein [Bacteroidota bacterium]
MISEVKKYCRLPSKERKLLNKIVIWLFLYKILIVLVPVRKYSFLFSTGNEGSSDKTKNYDLQLIEMLTKSVRRSRKIVPWKNKCMAESLAAKRILNKKKISSIINFGVKKDSEGKIIMHAWLCIGDKLVAGGDDFSKFEANNTF